MNFYRSGVSSLNMKGFPLFQLHFFEGCCSRREFGSVEYYYFKSLQISRKDMDKVKRRNRVSNSCKRNKHVAKSEEEQNPSFGCPVAAIPLHIWFDILLMLSVKGLLVCRCVCKTWRAIISKEEFAKMYYEKSHVILIRPLSSSLDVSRSLYLLEPPNHKYSFEHQYSSSSIDHFLSIKMDAKLKFPLQNSDLELRIGSQAKESKNRKHPNKLRAGNDRFSVANSCSGLLCLFNPYKNDQVVVYNPITGEYISLPTPTPDVEDPGCFVKCALGFSSLDKKYKVIRMFEEYRWAPDPIMGLSAWSGCVAELHTVGTNSWRRIGNAPYRHDRLGCATYLDGAIHWLYFANRRTNYIISFDFGKEIFQSIPPPDYETHAINLVWSRNVTLAELRGCLCMCFPSSGEISIWVMKTYGIRESWTKEFCLATSPSLRWWKMDSYKPITILSNGSLLLFQPTTRGLFWFEPNGEGYKYLHLCGKESGKEPVFEIMAFIPTFMSLKDTIVGDEFEVQNINSRNAGFKLQRKTKSLSLEEKLLIWDD